MGPKILIVDDTPANLDLLAELLEPRGSTVLAAPSGDVAAPMTAKADPDLILLDVLMPNPDGYETCRRLKADPATRDMPVLFISAKDESQSLVDGFAAGAVDYIAKPFQPEEVIARVTTHLSLSRLARDLRDKNTELQRRSTDPRRRQPKNSATK